MPKKKTTSKKKKQVFDLLWLCEDWTEQESFYQKRMFGGLSLYLHGKMMLFLA